MEQSLSQSATLGNEMTPGRLCHIPSHLWLDYRYVHNGIDYEPIYRILYNHLNENDTYITILNIDNQVYGERYPTHGAKIYKMMQEDPHIKIVWESEMAVNRRPGHGTKPRNKMIVFEYVKNPDVPS